MKYTTVKFYFITVSYSEIWLNSISLKKINKIIPWTEIEMKKL